MNDLKDFDKIFSKITKEQWQQLFDLIPVIAKTKNFGKAGGNLKQPDGTYTFPYIINSEVVSEFQNLVYEIGLVISFDWPSWDKGKQLLNDSKTDFSVLDVQTLCMMITMIVRANRFSEGYLVNCFNDGIIIKILNALKEKVNN